MIKLEIALTITKYTINSIKDSPLFSEIFITMYYIKKPRLTGLGFEVLEAGFNFYELAGAVYETAQTLSVTPFVQLTMPSVPAAVPSTVIALVELTATSFTVR